MSVRLYSSSGTSTGRHVQTRKSRKKRSELCVCCCSVEDNARWHNALDPVLGDTFALVARRLRVLLEAPDDELDLPVPLLPHRLLQLALLHQHTTSQMCKIADNNKAC